MVFGSAQLFTEFIDLAIVLSVLVEGCQRFLLLLLHLQERLGLFLQLLQNSLLVLLLIFESNDLLDVVGALKLSAHVLNFFLVELYLILRLL